MDGLADKSFIGLFVEVWRPIKEEGSTKEVNRGLSDSCSDPLILGGLPPFTPFSDWELSIYLRRLTWLRLQTQNYYKISVRFTMVISFDPLPMCPEGVYKNH